MNIGYIYLLQEREFVRTKENIYKVGMTTKENHKRFAGYKKGYIILFQMSCSKKNVKNIEKKIIKLFKETFEWTKDFGNETFSGDYKSMIDKIYLTIKDEEQDNNEDHVEDNEEQEQEQKQEQDNNEEQEEAQEAQEEAQEESEEAQEEANRLKLLSEEIGKVFNDYKNDESFKGNKKYIKISKVGNEYIVYYINPKLNHTSKIYEYDDFICMYEININVGDELQYFHKLISKKIVCLDKVYDINSINFINKINKEKLTITVENFDDFKTHQNDIENITYYNKIEDTIRQLFHCNTIINTSLYCTTCVQDNGDNIFKKFKKLKDFDTITIDVGREDYIPTTLYKIHSKYYDYITFLRKYMPYCIEWNINKNYYLINRDYEYIGLNTKSIEKSNGSMTTKREYLFNDGCEPLNKQSYIIFYDKYIKIVKDNSLNECLNMDKNSLIIINNLYYDF